MPINAFCTKPGVPEEPIHNLVLWNSFSPYVSVTKFENLSNMRMSYIDRTKTSIPGTYLFTLDWHNPETNILDDGYSENPGQHKCGHVIQRDDGNFAIQPNNRIRVFDPNFTYDNTPIPRKIANKLYTSEGSGKWHVSNDDEYEYGVETITTIYEPVKNI